MHRTTTPERELPLLNLLELKGKRSLKPLKFEAKQLCAEGTENFLSVDWAIAAKDTEATAAIDETISKSVSYPGYSFRFQRGNQFSISKGEEGKIKW